MVIPSIRMGKDYRLAVMVIKLRHSERLYRYGAGNPSCLSTSRNIFLRGF